MQPPYDITAEILKLISSISMKMGEVNANHLNRPSPILRKQNRIKTVHSSLGIEGNKLTVDQVTAILENKRVIGPKKEVEEVMNALNVYDSLGKFNPYSSTSFLEAHKLLMRGLVPDPGKYRKQRVGILHGDNLAHVAPPFERVPFLMNDLFDYVKRKDELTLIASCVFHYEMEFIHPFVDGNGRMGRLWQTLLLAQEFPVFEFLSLETLIRSTQVEYYRALALSDQVGKSTPFITYMLDVMDKSLGELLQQRHPIMTDLHRLEYFIQLNKTEFSRKEYLDVFKDISTATASRDLIKGVEINLLEKIGEKNKTRYRVI
jgi:Fic family protein